MYPIYKYIKLAVKTAVAFLVYYLGIAFFRIVIRRIFAIPDNDYSKYWLDLPLSVLFYFCLEKIYKTNYFTKQGLLKIPHIGQVAFYTFLVLFVSNIHHWIFILADQSFGKAEQYRKPLDILILPLLEEAFFRFYLLKDLNEKIGFWNASLVSSILFSSLHVLYDFTFGEFISHFAAGLFLCHYMKVSNFNLIGSVFIHLISNVIIYLIIYSLNN